MDQSDRPVETTHHSVPRIIPRSEHPVSRKNIDKEALRVLYRLRDAGYTAYLVGGGVRDLYLGKVPKDFDISTNAKPGQVRKLFRNSRLIGRRFRLVQVYFRGDKIVEVSTFRRRSEFDIATSNDSDKPEVLAANNTYGTPEDDAFRRDLTINSLFYEIETFSIIDYTGGVEDLDRGIIRLIGTPEVRITRDPARMMRVIRHAARNNFTIEKSTWLAIQKHRHELNLCPVSRIRDELLKDLRSGACNLWLKLAIDSGLFTVLLPAYETILSSPDKQHDVRKQLTNILGVIDQYHCLKKVSPKKNQLPEPILLTLLLLPLASVEMDIFNINLRGAEAYRYARRLRERIDEVLGHFHIKRHTKEIITTILANLNHFHRHDKLPKWLKRKSYFKDCKRIYDINFKAQGGEKIDPAVFDEISEAAIGKPKQKRGRGGRKAGRPSFATKSHTGVFGLRQKSGKKN